MTKLLAGTCVAIAALGQLALTASGGAGDPRGLPLLPLAVLAAWSAARGPGEAWAGLLPAPLLLGLASDERVGWFLLALLPTPLLAAALRGSHSAWRSIVVSAAAAAPGLALYTLLLFVVAGDLPRLVEEPAYLAGGVLWTCLLAALLAAVLLLFRPHQRGLFG